MTPIAAEDSTWSKVAPTKRRLPVITLWSTVSPESGERRKSVFAPPEPQPSESGEETSCHRRENGGEFRHCRHYTGHFATISVSFSLLGNSCQIASVTKGMKGWRNCPTRKM